jgi:hypothetical protein
MCHDSPKNECKVSQALAAVIPDDRDDARDAETTPCDESTILIAVANSSTVVWQQYCEARLRQFAAGR